MRLPFDAHNHVHLGPSSALSSLLSGGTLRGMAIMSTHPRDFDQVSHLATSYTSSSSLHIVPCFGVHPWFLGDEPLESNWIETLTTHLETTPHSIVGEIGLDGFHFHPDAPDELAVPMERQVEVFEHQMKVAHQLQRPVSLHAVQSWGPLMNSLAKLKKNKTFPPSIYFHAFGGKAGTTDQLLALCRQANCEAFFGFAPCVNFRSPKTSQIAKKLGIERLVLESDREDASKVNSDITENVAFLADALELETSYVLKQTFENAKRLYRF